MSCPNCNTNYGLFNKEVGCGSCELSCCSKCLRQKYKILGNEKVSRVCNRCYTRLTQGTETNTHARPPPDIFLKRLATLENPSAPPITVYKHDRKVDELRKGLTSDDQKLVDRLERLKEHEKPLPTEDELRERLDALKGEANKSSIVYDYKAHDLRSDEEKIDSLLDQYINEEQIKQDHDPVKDLEGRIAKLKGERAIKRKQKVNVEDSESSEEETERIVRKAVSQVAIEEKRSKSLEKDDITKFEEELNEDKEELPWCILCNENAAFRCLDCGGDLYCKRCSREAHREWGEKDHRIVEYKNNNNN